MELEVAALTGARELLTRNRMHVEICRVMARFPAVETTLDKIRYQDRIRG